MDQWDASLGNSDATWNCIEAVAGRGGFKGSEAALMEVMDGKEASDVSQRPWRWWNEATRLAHANGNDLLAGRIFLFTHLTAPPVDAPQAQAPIGQPHGDSGPFNSFSHGAAPRKA